MELTSFVGGSQVTGIGCNLRQVELRRFWTQRMVLDPKGDPYITYYGTWMKMEHTPNPTTGYDWGPWGHRGPCEVRAHSQADHLADHLAGGLNCRSKIGRPTHSRTLWR